MVAPEVLICNFHFARNGDFFFFQKALDFLNFRPFTNIFLGQKRRKKNPTKCLSQLLTSTMNHGHKTTAMWLTKKLCVFTSHYRKSFSNLHYVICRQTGGRTNTPLWVLSRQSYNHGHRRMTLHFTHFPFLILFWEITLEGLNLPPLLLSRGGMWCVCVCVCACTCAHACTCVHASDWKRKAKSPIQLISQVETSIHFQSPFFIAVIITALYFGKVIFTWEAYSAFSDSGKLIN